MEEFSILGDIDFSLCGFVNYWLSQFNQCHLFNVDEVNKIKCKNLFTFIKPQCPLVSPLTLFLKRCKSANTMSNDRTLANKYKPTNVNIIPSKEIKVNI